MKYQHVFIYIFIDATFYRLSRDINYHNLYINNLLIIYRLINIDSIFGSIIDRWRG